MSSPQEPVNMRDWAVANAKREIAALKTQVEHKADDSELQALGARLSAVETSLRTLRSSVESLAEKVAQLESRG